MKSDSRALLTHLSALLHLEIDESTAALTPPESEYIIFPCEKELILTQRMPVREKHLASQELQHHSAPKRVVYSCQRIWEV